MVRRALPKLHTCRNGHKLAFHKEGNWFEIIRLGHDGYSSLVCESFDFELTIAVWDALVKADHR